MAGFNLFMEFADKKKNINKYQYINMSPALSFKEISF